MVGEESKVEHKVLHMVKNCQISLFFFFLLAGIRSQSKPQDIMAEVYKAMLSLGYVRDAPVFKGIKFYWECVV